MPRQERSRRTLARIVAAARDILAEAGADAVTVQAVVKRARASVGSFYARFSGKDELLAYLEERVRGEVRERWDAACAGVGWDELPLEDTLAEVVRLLAEGRRVAWRERHALAARGERDAREREFLAHVRTALAGRVLAHGDAIDHPSPTLAVEVALRAAQGALAVGEGDGEDVLPPPDALAGELVRLLLAYLVREPDGARAARSGPVDFFDVWDGPAG